jgi:hypothetical protein
VPNFFIDKFRVPLFLLPIYQAAGNEYGVPWQVLAAINEIETDYGRNMSVSSAGAEGWMQFLPSTWAQYGVDATQTGKKDPYNPADAIFAAARYLKAAGADKNLRGAIFAYNHATWYVDSVMLRAKLIGGVPDALLGSLTGLTQGHFPVAAPSRYADDPADLAKAGGKGANAPLAQSVHIFARSGSPVIAVQDGKVIQIGNSQHLGNFIRLKDTYGNTYTYGHLKQIVSTYPVPKPQAVSQAATRGPSVPGANDAAPTQPATAGDQPAQAPAPGGTPPPASGTTGASGSGVTASGSGASSAGSASGSSAPSETKKERLFANPGRPGAYHAGGQVQLSHTSDSQSGQSVTADLSTYFTQAYGLRRGDVILKPLKAGSNVIAGTILGRIGVLAKGVAPHVLFQIRPGGAHTPVIDPKPILDGWKLLEATAIYKAAGQNPFLGPNAKTPTAGQVFLMSKEALAQRVLSDSNISIYKCGRRDIAAGGIDRRVLATLEFLSVNRLKISVSALQCGAHPKQSQQSLSSTGPSGPLYASGNAVDITKVNGVPIAGHQGTSSIADLTIRRLLTLQGLYKPHDIVSTMTYPGTDNTISQPDHADHIQVDFLPMYSDDPRIKAQVNQALRPNQWIKLINRLRQIPNPVVSPTPSKAAINASGNGG